MTVSKKKRQQSSLANQKAVAKYKRANYDDIKLRVPKGYRRHRQMEYFTGQMIRINGVHY